MSDVDESDSMLDWFNAWYHGGILNREARVHQQVHDAYVAGMARAFPEITGDRSQVIEEALNMTAGDQSSEPLLAIAASIIERGRPDCYALLNAFCLGALVMRKEVLHPVTVEEDIKEEQE